VCGGERGCEEGFGFGELEVAGGVVGLAGASVGCAGDGDTAAVEDFDFPIFVGDGYECSPAGVDADADGGAMHGGPRRDEMPEVLRTSVIVSVIVDVVSKSVGGIRTRVGGARTGRTAGKKSEGQRAVNWAIVLNLNPAIWEAIAATGRLIVVWGCGSKAAFSSETEERVM
jgi:hypothetical protein